MSEELTAEEMAQQFGEPSPEAKVDPYPDENLYAIVARLKNGVGFATNSNVTPVGTQLCNTYAHILKSLYDLSHCMPDEEGEELRKLLRKHESFPADFVGMIHGNLVEAKKSNDKLRSDLFIIKERNYDLERNLRAFSETINALTRPKSFWEKLKDLFR